MSDVTRVLRWGRSAYETDAQLEAERAGLASLGCEVAHHVGPRPPMAGVRVLVVTSKVRVDDAVLSTPGLALALTTTSGYDHLDRAAAEARGVRLARCPLARRDAVVDTSMAMALSLLRGLPGLHRRAEQGAWARGELPARRMRLVRGLDVGVIGYGVIGHRATEAWRNLGARVRWHDPAVAGSLPLADLMAMSEVVTLHCSLTEGSRRVIN